MRRTRVEAAIDEERGVFMISVAAELADMHPQTLRMYEARGLITPKRSPKNTRLYSQRDVERLRRIQQMTSEEGLNLAGVETVLEMEERVEKMRGELERMRKRSDELQQQLEEEVERVRRSLKAEIVPYKAYDVIPDRPVPVKIPIERTKRDRRGA
jgi:MerR family transcriptional regulator, heat shock protein HspR